MRLFSFYPQASDVGETHSLVPDTEHYFWSEFKIFILTSKLLFSALFEKNYLYYSPVQGDINRKFDSLRLTQLEKNLF
jgi:hypothetical protein